MKIPEEVYQAIADEITSSDSPVGIDAKKTHIIIIHMLRDLSERLARLEAQLEENKG